MICHARLSASCMTTPAIGVLLGVFISQSRFKRTAMGGASDTTSAAVNARLSQSRQEKFIDDACTREADPTPGGPSGMSRDDEANALSCWLIGVIRQLS